MVRFKVYSDSNSKDIVDELTNWSYNQFEDFEDICDLLNKITRERDYWKAVGLHDKALMDKYDVEWIKDGYDYRNMRYME